MWKMSDCELLQVTRPRCPKCKKRMATAAVEEGPEGFERRSFECFRCARREEIVVACDPMDPDAVGWLSSNLRAPK
jgi:hypothetical protein